MQQILAQRPKNRGKWAFCEGEILSAQDFGARFLPLRGLRAILGTPGWNCSVDCTNCVVLWRNYFPKSEEGSAGWEGKPVEGSVGWEGLSKMKLVLLSSGSVTGLVNNGDPLSTTITSHVKLSLT